MQHVTFQTAIAMRDAGFPQPETVEHSQSWYSCRDELFIINQKCHHTGISPGLWFACRPAFAPTAPDILRELGEAYSLTTCGPFFRVEQMRADEYFVVAYWQDTNPAEACAKAWLEKNKPVSS